MVKGEGAVFRNLLMRKCVGIPSVLFSFLKAASKCRQRATKAEIKYIMSAQLKTHLPVRGGGQIMVEKMIDWETHAKL